MAIVEKLTAAILDLVELYCSTFNANFHTMPHNSRSTAPIQEAGMVTNVLSFSVYAAHRIPITWATTVALYSCFGFITLRNQFQFSISFLRNVWLLFSKKVGIRDVQIHFDDPKLLNGSFTVILHCLLSAVHCVHVVQISVLLKSMEHGGILLQLIVYCQSLYSSLCRKKL